MRCASHPEVETNLKCGKCSKPICPKCLVQTPVGARCPDCVRLCTLPTYRVSFSYYLRAIGAALGTAIVCGIVWATVDRFVPLYVDLLLLPGIGYAIGEVVSLSVNRKRGRWLVIVAGIGVAISYLVIVLVPGGGRPIGLFSTLLDLLAVAVGIYFAVTRLR